MSQHLDYASTARASDGAFARRAFTLLAALSATLLVIVCTLWVVSYIGTTPAFKPGSGFAISAPPGPHIPIPMPSDYPQYWVPLDGNLERWEYAAVGGGWFRWHRGIPFWIPALIFALVPTAWLFRRYRIYPVGGA